MNEIAMLMIQDEPKTAKKIIHPFVKMVLDDANCFYSNKKYIVEVLIPHYKFLRNFSNVIVLTSNEKTVKVDLDELIYLLEVHTWQLSK